MLASRQIEAGKCYVNEEARNPRQILRVERQTVVFSDYDLETGKLRGAPNKRCTRQEIIHWADREATLGEARSLKQEEQEALFRTHPASDGPSQAADPLAGLHEASRRSNFMK